MDWLLPSVLSVATASLILVFVYSYLYFIEKKRFLLLWTFAWSSNCLRFVFLILIIINSRSPFLFFFNQFFSYITAVFLYLGTYSFLEKEIKKYQKLILSLGTFWILTTLYSSLSFRFITIPLFTVQGFIFFITGTAFFRNRKAGGGRSAWFIGIVFILWAIHKLDYPFLYPVKVFTPYGFWLEAVFELTAAMGMIIFYLIRNREMLVRATKELEKSRSVQGSIILAMNESLVLLSKEREILFLNEKAEIFFNKTTRKIIQEDGSEIWHIIHEDGSPYMAGYHPASFSLNTGIPLENKIIGITDNRTVYWLSVNTEPMFRENEKEPYSVVITFRDITENRMTEKELEESTERLRRKEKAEAIGQLAGGVAHDFNNQLAGIMGYADLLKIELEGNDNLVAYTDNIITSARRSADVVKQLLAFARIDRHKSVIIDIHDLLHELFLFIEHSFDKKIIIEKKFQATDITVLGDPSLIQNAFMNVALNSRDSMPGGGVLTIRSDNILVKINHIEDYTFPIKTGKYIRITISDTGCGIDDKIIDRIFQPFFSTKEGGTGTGMGLAAVYGIVKSHNGYINVKSVVGKGTDFEFFFPAVEVQNAAEEAVIISGGEFKKGGTILVIDDEPSILELFSGMLKSLGFQVLSSGIAHEALSVFNKNRDKIILVIVDMIMPDINGVEIIRIIREIKSDIKVLISSGYGKENIDDDILDEGNIDFIQKPFVMQSLSEKIKELL